MHAACHHPATGGVVPYYDIEFLLICLSVVGFQNLVPCADEQFRLGTKKHSYRFVLPVFSMREVAHDACALSNKVGLVLCNALIAVNTIISQRII